MEIIKRMVLIMGELGAIKKEGKNSHQGYSFRGIDQFLNALHPLLSKHEVVIIPQVLERTEQIIKGEKTTQKHVSLKVNYQFTTTDGSNISVVTYGEGIDTSDKATNKAMSAALKYALMQTFSVPTEDVEDADKTSPQIENDYQKLNAEEVNRIGKINTLLNYLAPIVKGKTPLDIKKTLVELTGCEDSNQIRKLTSNELDEIIKTLGLK